MAGASLPIRLYDSSTPLRVLLKRFAQVRWALYVDGTFYAGDNHVFMHADTRAMMGGERPFATGVAGRGADSEHPVVYVLNCKLVSAHPFDREGRRAQLDLLLLTDAFGGWCDGVTPELPPNSGDT